MSIPAVRALREAASVNAPVIDALRMAASILSLGRERQAIYKIAPERNACHLYSTVIVSERGYAQAAGGTTLKRPKSKVISAKDVRQLLEATEYSVDHELSSRLVCQVFDLAGGRVLLVYGKARGRLYESRAELCSMLDAAVRQPSGVNPFRELLPQGSNFANEVPKLVCDLPARLGLDATELNGSEASLDRIDQAMRRLGRSRISAKVLTSEVFAPLTAYVGEVIRNATGGRWEMRRGSDGETWEPWIVDPLGRDYKPFAIYKELFEYDKSSSLRAVVRAQLAWRLLGGG